MGCIGAWGHFDILFDGVYFMGMSRLGLGFLHLVHVDMLPERLFLLHSIVVCSIPANRTKWKARRGSTWSSIITLPVSLDPLTAYGKTNNKQRRL
jgi:hypothetical protein